MQHWPLVMPRILDYAAKFHGDQEVVTRTVEGPIVRCTYRDVQGRAKLCALALKRLGARCAQAQDVLLEVSLLVKWWGDKISMHYQR